MFGTVQVNRLAYRAPQRPNLHPADAALNLPTERQSHRIRRLAALEARPRIVRPDPAGNRRATGQKIGKRQLEQLADRAAVDVKAYYAKRPPPQGQPYDLLVLSYDSKDVVMRPGALRPHQQDVLHPSVPPLLADRRLPGRLDRARGPTCRT